MAATCIQIIKRSIEFCIKDTWAQDNEEILKVKLMFPPSPETHAFSVLCLSSVLHLQNDMHVCKMLKTINNTFLLTGLYDTNATLERL